MSGQGGVSPDPNAAETITEAIEAGSSYEGPLQIGYAEWPGRGTTYHFKLAGRDIQLYVTEKRKKIRVFVDHEERK